MHLHWRNGFLVGLICLQISFNSLSQNSSYALEIKENLISDKIVNFELGPCWAIILISKDQCSNCNSGVVTLLSYLKANEFYPIIARVSDQSPMNCKKDELQFKSESREVQFQYIVSKNLKLIDPLIDDTLTLEFNSTPALVYFSKGRLTKIESEELTDQFGQFNVEVFPKTKCKSE